MTNDDTAQPSGDMVEAVKDAIANTTDFDGDRMASRYADSELRDLALSAIAAMQPHIDAARREGFEAGARAMQEAKQNAICVQAYLDKEPGQ